MAELKPRNTSAAASTPTDVARETIKKMAMQRIAPTPDNYQRIYNEIAGIAAEETLENALNQALRKLPNDTAEQSKWIGDWKKLLVDGNWAKLPALLAEGMGSKTAQSRQWPDAIRELLRNWEARQAGLTSQRKKEALERVLINFGSDPQLPQKIQAMSKSWAEYGTGPIGPIAGSLVDDPAPEAESIKTEPANIPSSSAIPVPGVAQTPAEPSAPAPGQTVLLQEAFRAVMDMLRQSLKHGLIPRLEDFPELKTEASQISILSESICPEDWQSLSKQLRALLTRVELIGEEEGIQHDLLRLLKLLIDNISELVADDRWIRGQISMVQTIISSPLDKTRIKDAEKNLKEVIFKQGTLKHSLTEAKNAFKQMITTFIERLGLMSDSTGAYHGKIVTYADQLSKMDDIIQINMLLENLMHDTQVMQSDILRSHDVLMSQRDQAAESEEKIQKLEEELTQLSEKVRTDQLTGMLNRQGLDEAFVSEIARAQRGDSALSVVLLDIDNFKRLNDTHGHSAGDVALRHLADIVKAIVRPTDVVARFGGEEFVVLLPDTDMEEAANIITRLQRQLTKKFFMHNNERLLITFSAGIALFKLQELQESVIRRADQAMYLAKKLGKNRVVTEKELASA